ncbi:MAG: glutamine--fructose-6-phosphate transaminase (isomerizing) [Oscillospiraceae bacterium]|nr:glutamine--fructose-6-phosphate transaminase (isomerizing) [Oscillospiraceae bacterium]
MCGIVGFTGKQQAAPFLLESLKKLEYRGYDSAGIAVIDNGTILVRKTSGKIENLVEATEGGRSCPGVTGIGHTRWATHGAPTETNAHPHVSNNGKFAVVHNGIIENYLDLKKSLIGRGYRFDSETDTEVIVHLLEDCDTGNTRTAIMKAASQLRGSYALGVISADEPGTVYALRDGSPLILGIGTEENYFASDVTALVAHTKNVIYLDDGELAAIAPGKIEIFDAAGTPLHKKSTRVTWDIQAAEKGGYDHFMLKEIMEQPRAVKAALAPRLKKGNIRMDEIDLPVPYLQGITRIIITACGSAFYAGCAARSAFESLCRIPVDTELASELRYKDPIVDENTLVIAVSQSGETADTIAAVKECKSLGARVLGIVNVVGSSIAKLADSVLYTYAGPEIAVATTKGYTTQVAVLTLFALYLAHVRSSLTEKEYRNGIEQLNLLPRRIQETIDLNHGIAALARKICFSRSVFYIGRGTDHAVALEGALKLKEISYIHAEAYPAGELKHGTIALIEDLTPVVAVCCCDAIADKTANNIIEVKARGAKVLAIAPVGDKKTASLADDIIYVPRTDPLYAAAVQIIPLQLLAYYAARENGCDIDKPKNLAKSVTVE